MLHTEPHLGYDLVTHSVLSDGGSQPQALAACPHAVRPPLGASPPPPSTPWVAAVHLCFARFSPSPAPSSFPIWLHLRLAMPLSHNIVTLPHPSSLSISLCLGKKTRTPSHSPLLTLPAFTRLFPCIPHFFPTFVPSPFESSLSLNIRSHQNAST